jgi:prepilin-type N-terminal cleavage/methylation domain-containing protein
MGKRSGFTLIELLVVIAIVALLMAILMPALQRVKKQAQAVACMSNIKQWSYCWHMYLEDSGGKFPTGDGASGDWPDNLRPFYKDRGALTLCPMATKPYTDGGKVPFGAWRWTVQGGGWTNFEDKPGEDYGSYGMDEWLSDREGENYWRTREQKKASTIPLFFDKGYINTVFLDLNVRKVGLKELWTLNWHRNFDTEGIWTTAGGATASDWPDWMRHLKEF